MSWRTGRCLPDTRELVILRLSYRAGVAYEWHHHFARASQAGISVAEAEAVRTGPPVGWADEQEALLLTVTDELFDELAVGDAAGLNSPGSSPSPRSSIWS